ncbi:hypothetical protein P3T34_005592 [Kitasatospora sp. MAP12-44]|uniref:hypothetical protein n=1 Tax=Kitasatospora sp. MAP12-44 TaxID=3035099 RepID=UPI0024748B74|nr:hypothetical protein [Kitasatospora sp. MAP12-44]MDH6113377.1 hypothetical protein [Kitasatospora sp. MAP12-44]
MPQDGQLLAERHGGDQRRGGGEQLPADAAGGEAGADPQAVRGDAGGLAGGGQSAGALGEVGVDGGDLLAALGAVCGGVDPQGEP